jgi:hypothetical protein
MLKQIKRNSRSHTVPGTILDCRIAGIPEEQFGFFITFVVYLWLKSKKHQGVKKQWEMRIPDS